MPNIRELCSNGFVIPELERDMDSIALLSLKIALKSYFSTYETMAYYGRYLDENELEKENYSLGYVEQYFETIIHFQHFFELICKDILREVHELLVLNIDNNHEVLFNLVMGEDVQEESLINIKTIEFERTFKRLCNLINNGKINPAYSFFNELEVRQALEQLNILRNRMWHRGIYVMEYKDFDIFIGKYILPIIEKVSNTDKYINLRKLWTYKEKDMRIDPLKEIIKTCDNEQPYLSKIALLKEMGRAAYQNPLHVSLKFMNKKISKRAEDEALNAVSNNTGNHIFNCPVCNINSLVQFIDYDDVMVERGEISHQDAWYVESIKCYCCSFELLSSGMKNPKEYGYDLPDYWSVK